MVRKHAVPAICAITEAVCVKYAVRGPVLAMLCTCNIAHLMTKHLVHLSSCHALQHKGHHQLQNMVTDGRTFVCKLVFAFLTPAIHKHSML